MFDWHKNLKLITAFFVGVFVFLAACSENNVNDQPLSYDPPGATNTKDKEIIPQQRGTFGFDTPGVWVSNDFQGGRINEFKQIDEKNYVAIINPENAPINRSAWYAFKIWAKQTMRIRLKLAYNDGNHRYYPKLSRNGKTWTRLDSTFYMHDTTHHEATLTLDIGTDTLWVSAQELLTSPFFEKWTDSLAVLPFVRKSVLAHSRQGRPLNMLEIANNEQKQGIVLVISRQHPPEVTGSFALVAFIETLCGASDLAAAFRTKFGVVAVPLMNPDGVDNGHWRHNAAGVDLNRDWLHFNQPETRAVSREFLKYKNRENSRVYFCIDFHSTQEDVFYTLSKNLTTFPDQFTDEWLRKMDELLPGYEINEAPGGTSSPTSKSWFYLSFGAPSVTYEVGDEVERSQIKRNAAAAANALMELLLAEMEGK